MNRCPEKFDNNKSWPGLYSVAEKFDPVGKFDAVHGSKTRDELCSSKLCESLLNIMSTGTHVVNITITFAPAGRR